jgi:hypothetical protein
MVQLPIRYRADYCRSIIQARCESKRQLASEMCSVSWLRPNLAYSMDDCRNVITGGGRLLLHNLLNLCSNYKLPTIASGYLHCVEGVAGHLDQLSSSFGAPLFCKLDNGGNLNPVSVSHVFSRAMEIPFNSPVYAAPYNGAFERIQGEFKGYLKRW